MLIWSHAFLGMRRFGNGVAFHFDWEPIKGFTLIMLTKSNQKRSQKGVNRRIRIKFRRWQNRVYIFCNPVLLEPLGFRWEYLKILEELPVLLPLIQSVQEGASFVMVVPQFHQLRVVRNQKRLCVINWIQRRIKIMNKFINTCMYLTNTLQNGKSMT